MTTTAILNPAEWIPRIRPLLDANWDETGFDFPFNPDAAMYQRLFEAGIAFAVGGLGSYQAIRALSRARRRRVGDTGT